MSAPQAATLPDSIQEAFADSRMAFEQVVGWLAGSGTAELTHGELETQLDVAGRALICRLLQDHVNLRALTEARRDDIADGEGILRRRVETGHTRGLATIFGDVTLTRMAYRQPGHANLHPADAALNLPQEIYSHGLRRLVAIEAARDSYDATAAAISRATGQQLGHRQLGQLIQAAAADFDGFYATRAQSTEDRDGDVLVLSADGKGIVMRPDALRPATAKAAADASPKLATRLSKGEKSNRKRMATVASVYDIAPQPRTPADIIRTTSDPDGDQPRAERPKARNKWLTASVTDDAATIIAAMFDQAQRRDPDHDRTWVALVDGNTHQIDRITTEAKARGIPVTVLVDFVHVLEYIWAAAWCFFNEGEQAAETWVGKQATRILQGHARQVATAIARKAAVLERTRRSKADDAVTYLRNKAPHLDYPNALAAGWPIATGVIEGAVRHLVVDRLDITGARWGLEGAEAILKLRALTTNGDFDAYWTHHLDREHHRVHHSRYAPNIILQAA